MKKVITGLLAASMCLSLCACRFATEHTAQMQPSDNTFFANNLAFRNLKDPLEDQTAILEIEDTNLTDSISPEMEDTTPTDNISPEMEDTSPTDNISPEMEDTSLTDNISPDEDEERILFLPSDDSVEGAETMTANPLYTRFKELLGFDPTEKKLDYAFSGSDCVSVIFADHQLIVPNYTMELGGGSKLQLPMTYQDLCDAGWSANVQLDEDQPTDPVPGEDYQWYNFINADGNTINAEIGNYSASPAALKDAVVTQLQAGGELTEAYNFSGIQAGATVQEIVDQFGLPFQCSYYCWEKNVEDFELYYIDDINYSHISFTIDPETGLLDSICYCVLLHPDDRPA